jgi:hypothetical protein
MSTTSQIINNTKITTCYEEPWSQRGESNSGRKPPSFAYYNRVNCSNSTNIAKLVKNLKYLTSNTSAHYLWYCNNTNSVEIWAHRCLIDDISKTIKNYIEKYDIINMNDYYFTSVKSKSNTDIGLLIANFKWLEQKPLHIWYNNKTKAVDIWFINFDDMESHIMEVITLIKNCEKRVYNKIYLGDYMK